jgi:hypothetical protein
LAAGFPPGGDDLHCELWGIRRAAHPDRAPVVQQVVARVS